MTRSPRSSGLTLIEMLVGMLITLVMMAAVVNLFANITAGVRNRQATMEVSAELRTARTRLYKDLAGATALKYPKDAFAAYTKPDSNNPPDGYFEIVEGNFSDEDPGGALDPALSMVPSSNKPGLFDADGNPLDPTVLTDGMGRGDYDDILALTVRSESEPFRGRGRGLRPGGDPSVVTGGPTNTGDWIDMTIESDLAEVIWYAVEDPETGLRRIYRRTLMIVPWYGTETRNINGTNVTGSDPLLDLTDDSQFPNGFPDRMRYMRHFQANYDISVRFERQRLVSNALADLSRREHRFAHMTNPTGYPGDTTNPVPGHFPYQFPYYLFNFDQFAFPGLKDVNDDDSDGDREELISSLNPLGDLLSLAPYWIPTGERTGEDLILSNALAFDVRVFDPGAPLYQIQGTLIQPSTAPSSPFVNAVASGPANISGFGTYADLGWNDGGQYDYATILTAIPTAPAPLFQQEHRIGWHPSLGNNSYFRDPPSSYDTWTTYYETDGVDQESRPFYSSVAAATWQVWQVDDGATTEIEHIDQGTNGLDDDNLNGPDDPAERETSPPYPYPLQGVQVKLRLYEPESRQIRETTVTRKLDE